MIREVVLRDFPSWDSEKQLSEFQAYKALGTYSPFNDADYALMEMVMNNPNAEVTCNDGACEIIATEESMSAMDKAYGVKDGQTKKIIEEETIFDTDISNKDIEEIVESSKFTQDEIDTLRGKLEKLAKRKQHLVVDDNYKVFDNAFDALKSAFKRSPMKLFELMYKDRYFDFYDFEMKGNDFIFTLEFDKADKRTKESVEEIALDNEEVVTVSKMVDYLDDDASSIDKHTVKKAEALLK